MATTKSVKLTLLSSYVMLENGFTKLVFLRPGGGLVSIQYGGIDNLLDKKMKESNRGYWDVNWNLPNSDHDRYEVVEGTEFSVISTSEESIEISFRTTCHSATLLSTQLSLSVDKRFIMRRGVSGFYFYAIFERAAGLPAFELAQTRMVFRLRRDKFHYMAISDTKQTVMPMPQDIVPPRGERLQLPESVWLRDPMNSDLKGEVDDKYMYSVDNKDGGLHGWISSGPPDPAVVGFWLVFPSPEFRSGGPTKQNLTNHTGPSCLAMFHGTHYIGDDIVASFANGEAWRKVYGPVFVYLNSTRSVNNAYDLWLDAKEKRLEEEKAWPYDFVSSPFFLMSSERGSAPGTLYIQDRFLSGSLIPASYAYVGLAASRTEGSWQTESKGYQFWTITDSKGAFTINNIIPGTYCVHGWVPGFVGDYIGEELVHVSPGPPTQLGNLTYVSHRDGATVWEIGFPDRTAMGFFVPDPNPNYVDKLFINCPEKYRQYGLWDRYTELHPESDQIFTVGVNDPKKDWFFAHVNRKIAEKKYSPTTWQIKFNLNGIAGGIYKLRLSVAASNHSDIQVRVNNPNSERPLFEVADLGMDNTVGRHGIHGLYQLFSVDVPSALLIKGDNIVYLTQANAGNQFVGVLYDYIRLEAPASPGHSDWVAEGSVVSNHSF